MNFREHSSPFRAWLQHESDRDRDTIIAYHNEFTKQSGLRNLARRAVEMFGVIAGGVASQALTTLVSPSMEVNHPIRYAALSIGAAAGGAAASYLIEIGTAMKDWKPVVFGNWLSEQVKAIEKET